MPTLKIVVIGLVLLAALVLMPLFYNKWRVAEQRVSEVTTYAKSKDDSVTYFQNKWKQEVATKEAVILDYKALQTLSNDRHLDYLKQFEGLKSNLKNLLAATNVTAQVTANIEASLKDTTVVVAGAAHPAFNFEKVDKWLQVTGVAIPDLKQVKLEVKTEVPLQGAMYWQRKRFLGLRIGKKQWKSEFTSPNPYVHLTQIEQIVIQKR